MVTNRILLQILRKRIQTKSSNRSANQPTMKPHPKWQYFQIILITSISRVKSNSNNWAQFLAVASRPLTMALMQRIPSFHELSNCTFLRSRRTLMISKWKKCLAHDTLWRPNWCMIRSRGRWRVRVTWRFGFSRARLLKKSDITWRSQALVSKWKT